MKYKSLCLILVFSLLLSLLAGCGDSGRAQEPSTEPYPPETTAPITTTLPPETAAETEPSETDSTVTMPPLDWRKENIEEKFGVETYNAPSLFLLKDPGLEIGFQDDSPVKLTLPQSWKDKFLVIEDIYMVPTGEDIGDGEQIYCICIASKNLMETYWKVTNTRAFDYSLALLRVKTDSYNTDGTTASDLKAYVESGDAAIVYQDETFVYLVCTAQCDQLETVKNDRESLLSEISEAQYQEAVGDITCTLEEAVAMCSVDEN